jgi:hypothetical protein
MIDYWKAVAWGAGILASFYGWGTLLRHLIWRGHAVGACRCAVWGFAVVIMIGGVMNLASVATRAGLFALVAAGWLPAAWSMAREWKQRRAWARGVRKQLGAQRPLAFFLGTLAFLLLMRVGSSVIVTSLWPWEPSLTARFNWHDDSQSYIVYPQKMLQTGSIGADPFNSRRNQASVGAGHLVVALMMGELLEDYAHLFEAGLALLLICGVTWEISAMMKLGWWWRGMLQACVLSQVPMTVNVTSYYGAAALMLAMLMTMMSAEWRELAWWRVGILVGMLVGALVALKTTFLPLAGILLAVDAVWKGGMRLKEWRRLAGIYAAMIAGVALVMAAWMFDAWRSTGTALYPILGRGFHGSRYGKVPLPSDGMSWEFQKELYWLVTPYLLVAAIAIVALWRSRTLPREWKGSIAGALLSSGLGFLIIGLGTGYTGGAERYVFSMALAGEVVMMGGLFVLSQQWISAGGASKTWGRLGPSLFGLLMARRVLHVVQIYFVLVPMNWYASFKGNLPYHAAAREQARRIQSVLPAGATILARLSDPYALDFTRHTIYVVDWPGDFSPPPGMPLREGSEKLAAYLENAGIRYVAYSYRDEAHYPRSWTEYRLGADQAQWDRTLTANTYDFQDNLKELGGTRKILYDDGDIFVIDLRQRELSTTKSAQ